MELMTGDNYRYSQDDLVLKLLADVKHRRANKPYHSAERNGQAETNYYQKQLSPIRLSTWLTLIV